MKRIFILSGIGRTGGSYLCRLFDSTNNTNSFHFEIDFDYFKYHKIRRKISELQFVKFRRKNEFIRTKFIKKKISKNIYDRKIDFFESLEKIYDDFSSNELKDINELLKKEILSYNNLTNLNKNIQAFFIHTGKIDIDSIKSELKEFNDSFFVFMIRNPIDIYCSFKKRYHVSYNNDSLLKSFLKLYKYYLQIISYFILQYHNKSYLIFYENLIKNQNLELCNLCNHLKIKFDENIKFSKFLNHRWSGNSAKGAINITKNKIYNYKKILNNFELKELNKMNDEYQKLEFNRYNLKNLEYDVNQSKYEYIFENFRKIRKQNKRKMNFIHKILKFLNTTRNIFII